MTNAEYNLFTSDLYNRVTAGTIDPATLEDARTVINSPQAQAVIRYFYTKLVIDPGPRPTLYGPVPSLRLLRMLRLVGTGKSNKEIARVFSSNVNVIKSHVSRLLRRTGTENRWHLGLWVRDHSVWLEREIHAAEVLETSNVNGVVFSDQLPTSDNMSTF